MHIVLSKKTVLFALFICLFTASYGKKTVIYGFVEDNLSCERLIGATIYAPQISAGTISNKTGFYSIEIDVNKNTNMLIASFVGYNGDTLIIPKEKVGKSFQHNFRLRKGINIDEVVVRERKYSHESGNIINIPIAVIKRLPTLGGETDIMKVLQMMPGVQRGTEGNSSLYVRGGTPDQNLILLDNVPLYYVQHMGGLYSIFDENAIKEVKLYKGDFPAQYGGRLSSVVDISMKDGHMNTYKGQVSLGILASKIFVEGPIIKEKLAFFASIRRNNLDLFTRAALLFMPGQVKSGYTFYDVNSKITLQPSKKDRMDFSFYYGDDIMYFKIEDTQHINDSTNNSILRNWTNKWGNIAANYRYRRIINSNIFLKANLSYMHYRYKYDTQNSVTDNFADNLISKDIKQFSNGITDFRAQIDLDYFVNNRIKIQTGYSNTNHYFNPGSFYFHTFSDSSILLDTLMGSPQIKAAEHAGYLSCKANLGDNIHITSGLRLSSYWRDKQVYKAIEPRLNASIHFDDKHSAHFSYSYNKQYIHMLTNNGLGMAHDIWLPTDSDIMPENAQQYAIGYKFNSEKFSATLDSYYKKMNNLITSSEGTSFINGMEWTKQLESNGTGKTFGIEVLMNYNTEKLNAYLSYAYLINNRIFPDINGGKAYAYKYSRPHTFALTATYNLSKTIYIGINQAFSSGDLITLGVAQYNSIIETFDDNEVQVYNTEPIIVYADKNNFRLPAYHRLDITIQFQKLKNYGSKTWILGCYNVYNRKNPTFFYYDYNSGNALKLYQVSAFPIIPSLSLKLDFQ